jgi:hypothetical protein
MHMHQYCNVHTLQRADDISTFVHLFSSASPARASLYRYPRLNSLRLWMSLDGYMSNPEHYAAQLNSVIALGEKHDLKFIVTLFNWWHSYPDWGGYSLLASISDPTVASYHMEPSSATSSSNSSTARSSSATFGASGDWNSHAPASDFLESIVLPNAHNPAVLLWDIGNEPQNGETPSQIAATQHFINLTASWLRNVAKVSAPLGLSACCGTHPNTSACLRTWNGFRPDVLLLHAYCQHCAPAADGSDAPAMAQFRENLDEAVALANEWGLPLVQTEGCWGEMDDKLRAESCTAEMKELVARGIGISPHALMFSKVRALRLKGL